MSSSQILRYINGMMDMADKSKLLQRHVALAITKSGKIISKPCVNEYRPYTFSKFMGTIHAEMNAICTLLGKNEYCILRGRKQKGNR